MKPCSTPEGAATEESVLEASLATKGYFDCDVTDWEYFMRHPQRWYEERFPEIKKEFIHGMADGVLEMIMIFTNRRLEQEARERQPSGNIECYPMNTNDDLARNTGRYTALTLGISAVYMQPAAGTIPLLSNVADAVNDFIETNNKKPEEQ